MRHTLTNLLSFFLAAACAFASDGLVETDLSKLGAIDERTHYRSADLEKVSATLLDKDKTISLKGWFNGRNLCKIEASPGLSGAGTDEFQLENGRVVFVSSTIKKTRGAIEDRIHLQNGKIVNWISSDPAFVAHGEDYASMAGRLNSEIKRFSRALSEARDGRKGQVVEGLFSGIDQGDYAHFKLRGDGGVERSFFILQTDAAIDRVLATPRRYKGRACRVRWEKRKEKIPEAGGYLEIDVLLGIEWLQRR